MELTTSLLATGGLVVLLAVTTLAWMIISLTRLHSKYDHLPGPKRTSFLFGNMHELISTTRSGDAAMAAPEVSTSDSGSDTPVPKLKPLNVEKFVEWANEFGDTYVVIILYRVFVVTRSPEAVKTILVNGDPKLFPKSTIIKARWLFNSRYLGEGLATAVDHDSWYIRRRNLDPLFHRSQLRLAFDAYNLAADHLTSELKEHADSGNTLTLAPLVHRSTLDVIMRTMFSIDGNHLASDFHQQAQSFTEVTFMGLQTAMQPFVEWNPFYFKLVQDVRKHIKDFRRLGQNMVEERITLVKTDDDVPHDLLTTLVKSHLDNPEFYSMEILLDEFVTIIVAGMETSANTLLFLLMELGRRPDVLNRLEAEVDEVVGKKSFISYEDITKFTYMSTVIKETLRVYPPATVIVRRASEDTVLDDLHIPKDTNVFVNIYGANRHPKQVKDPNSFDPDRFDTAQQTRVPAYSFVSFSLGPRGCIGQTFAQMEMKVMIAKFIQHYHLHLDKSETFLAGQKTTMFPLSNIKCKVTERMY